MVIIITESLLSGGSKWRGGGGVKHNFGAAAISSHLEIELNSRAFAALLLELGFIRELMPSGMGT